MNRLMRLILVASAISLAIGAPFPAFPQKAKIKSPADKQLPRAPMKTLTGFQGGVGSMEFSRDWRIMAASDGEAVKLWDVQTGVEIRSFKPHKVNSGAIAISPDGKILATGGCDEIQPGEHEWSCSVATIKLWDVQTGQEIRTLPGHQGYTMVRGERWIEAENRAETVTMYIPTWIDDLKFTPDGKVLASLAKEDKVKLWDVVTGREIKVWEGSHWYGGITFSPDGKIMAASGGGGAVLMDWQTGQTIGQLKEGSGPSPLVFSPDGRRIVAACGDETIKLWDIAKEKEIRTFFGHKDDPQAVAFSPDGKIVASGGFDKSIFIWDVESGQEIGRLPGHRGSVFALAFSPDGKILASAGAEKYQGGEYITGTIKFWDATSFANLTPQPVKIESQSQVKELTGHNNNVVSVAFSPDSKLLAFASLDATLKLWEIESGKELYSVRGNRDGGSYETVAFSPDGRTIATGSGVIQLLDAQSGAERIVLKKGITSGAKSLSFSPNGRTISSASGDFNVPIWDTENGRKLAGLTENLKDGFGVYRVAFSPDGKILASSSSKMIKLWDVQSEKMFLKWDAHAPYIQALAFSPDGKLLASAGFDKVIKLWDVQTGKLVKALNGHRDYVNSLAFSPDGKTLASGSNDFTIRFWDVASGKTRKTITEKYVIECVAYSPDGSMLAAAIYRGVKIWKL